MKKILLPLAALFVGTCRSLPALFDLAGTVRSAGMGVVGGGWADRAVGAAARAAGWDAAGLVRAAITSAPWVIGFVVVFFFADKLPLRRRWIAPVFVWLCWCLAVAGGLRDGWFAWSRRIDDLRLVAPVGLVESVRTSGPDARIFLNPSAVVPVAALVPKLVDQSITPEKLYGLSRSPARWRDEDRSRGFTVVLISGRLSDAKPLIRHLLDSPDWRLAIVDNQGLLFLRGSGGSRLEAAIPDFSTTRERAIYLAQYALVLDAAELATDAKRRMDEAMNLAGNDFDVLIRAASLAASHGRWERARKLAVRAATLRPNSFESNYPLACALIETGAPEKAFALASRLAAAHPDDFATLLLLARAARASGNFSAETDALERMLRLVGDEPEAAMRVHIHLAQSWTRRAFPDQALAHYRAALAGNPTATEFRDIREAITAIEKNRLPATP